MTGEKSKIEEIFYFIITTTIIMVLSKCGNVGAFRASENRPFSKKLDASNHDKMDK